MEKQDARDSVRCERREGQHAAGQGIEEEQRQSMRGMRTGRPPPERLTIAKEGGGVDDGVASLDAGLQEGGRVVKGRCLTCHDCACTLESTLATSTAALRMLAAALDLWVGSMSARGTTSTGAMLHTPCDLLAAPISSTHQLTTKSPRDRTLAALPVACFTTRPPLGLRPWSSTCGRIASMGPGSRGDPGTPNLRCKALPPTAAATWPGTPAHAHCATHQAQRLVHIHLDLTASRLGAPGLHSHSPASPLGSERSSGDARRGHLRALEEAGALGRHRGRSRPHHRGGQSGGDGSHTCRLCGTWSWLSGSSTTADGRDAAVKRTDVWASNHIFSSLAPPPLQKDAALSGCPLPPLLVSCFSPQQGAGRKLQ